MKLSNKVVVVTGASRGLGREIALRLSRREARLILIARSADPLERTRREVEDLCALKPMAIQCDISSEAEVKRMAALVGDSHGHVDILINNAAIAIHKPSLELSAGEMRRQFEVNFYGAFYCVQSFLPLMAGSGPAYILNVNSLAAGFPLSDNSVYAATKSALMRFSDGLRLELAGSGIRVGSLFPCLMRTSFQGDRAHCSAYPPPITIGADRVARKAERMITARKSDAYVRRSMFAMLMGLKRIFG